MVLIQYFKLLQMINMNNFSINLNIDFLKAGNGRDLAIRTTLNQH